MDDNLPLDDAATNQINRPSIYEKRKRILLEINFGMVIVGGIFFIVINYSRGLHLLSFFQALLCLFLMVLLVLVLRNHEMMNLSARSLKLKR